MILSLHDDRDFIFAYLEWMVVGKDGNPKNDGEYLLVRDLWKHRLYIWGEVIPKLVKMLDEHEANKGVKYIYWQNLKHDERVSRLLSRERALKKFQEKGELVWVGKRQP